MKLNGIKIKQMKKNNSAHPEAPKLILASSSPYRRELLERLALRFSCESPNIDETPKTNESAQDLVKRLALEKAQCIADRHKNALIIGSDQVALFEGQILGKPGQVEKAIEQLSLVNGQRVEFLTSLCLLNSQSAQYQLDVVPFCVHFRQLSSAQITAYINKELPLNCAGSFKSEGLGISLFEKMQGDDPNALIGLPLIRLISMLQAEGVDILN